MLRGNRKRTIWRKLEIDRERERKEGPLKYVREG